MSALFGCNQNIARLCATFMPPEERAVLTGVFPYEIPVVTILKVITKMGWTDGVLKFKRQFGAHIWRPLASNVQMMSPQFGIEPIDPAISTAVLHGHVKLLGTVVRHYPAHTIIPTQVSEYVVALRALKEYTAPWSESTLNYLMWNAETKGHLHVMRQLRKWGGGTNFIGSGFATPAAEKLLRKWRKRDRINDAKRVIPVQPKKRKPCSIM